MSPTRVGLAAGVLLLSALQFGAATAAVKPVAQRKVAPDFSLKDFSGKTVKLSDYKGKVVLLSFWATWCEPCKAEIPWFVEFEQKHKDQGLVVLGISMDDDGWDKVRKFISDHKMSYRVLQGTEPVAQSYGGVDSLPSNFFIDPQGRIASVHVGLVGKDLYQKDLAALLAARAAGATTAASSYNGNRE